MNRWGLAAEIANTALFLASDESSFITGVAVPVDGGFTTAGALDPSPREGAPALTAFDELTKEK
jgi:hypothetical protein